MSINEYKDQESYDKVMKEFQKSNPESAEFFKNQERAGVSIRSKLTH
jgi:hypothetical protein